MNKVLLIGRTTKEIKLEKYGKGKDAGVYAKVTLAIRNGKDKTDFIYCTLWGKTAEIAAEYVGKGDLVAFGGRLTSSSYEGEDGNMVFRTDVSINEIELIGGKRESEDDGDDEQTAKKANRRSK